MKIIAIDVMGADQGPKVLVKAGVKFVKVNLDYKIKFVGDQNVIKSFLEEEIPERIEIIHESKIAKKNANLKTLLKEDSSMLKAINLVKDMKADAIISTGDSRNFLALNTFVLKRIKGISRPAFMPVMPTLSPDKTFLMLDVGANLEVKAKYLYEWGIIASSLSKSIFKKNNPSVGILNIGTEAEKGFSYHQEADELIKSKPKLFPNYVGFVEPKKILMGEIDVVLADGYSGNLTLKTMEATASVLSKVVKNNVTKSLPRKLFALGLKGAFKDVKDHFDWRNYGGAWVIGVNGIAFKAHGSSDVEAIFGGLNWLKFTLKNDALKVIKNTLEQVQKVVIDEK